jgi:hypothetical protein
MGSDQYLALVIEAASNKNAFATWPLFKARIAGTKKNPDDVIKKGYEEPRVLRGLINFDTRTGAINAVMIYN